MGQGLPGAFRSARRAALLLTSLLAATTTARGQPAVSSGCPDKISADRPTETTGPTVLPVGCRQLETGAEGERRETATRFDLPVTARIGLGGIWEARLGAGALDIRRRAGGRTTVGPGALAAGTKVELHDAEAPWAPSVGLLLDGELPASDRLAPDATLLLLALVRFEPAGTLNLTLNAGASLAPRSEAPERAEIPFALALSLVLPGTDDTVGLYADTAGEIRPADPDDFEQRAHLGAIWWITRHIQMDFFAGASMVGDRGPRAGVGLSAQF